MQSPADETRELFDEAINQVMESKHLRAVDGIDQSRTRVGTVISQSRSRKGSGGGNGRARRISARRAAFQKDAAEKNEGVVDGSSSDEDAVDGADRMKGAVGRK